MQIKYPFGSTTFLPTSTLSFYDMAKKDKRFLDALDALEAKLVDGTFVVDRLNRKLSGLTFCRKGETSSLGTERFYEILRNLGRG